MSCGKTFRGGYALTAVHAVHTWLLELAAELEERLLEDKEDNHRTPQLLTVSVGVGNDSWGSGNHFSKSCSIRRVEAAAMAADAAGLVKRWANEQPNGWRITDLFLGASSFVDVQTTSITQFFKPTGGAASNTPAASPVAAAAAAGAEAGATKAGAEVNENTKDDEPLVVADEERIEMQKERPSSAGAVAKRVAPTSVHHAPSNDLLADEVEKTGDVEYIDESVFAELPLEIQKELRAAMKFEEIQKRAVNGAGGGGGSGKGGKSNSIGSKTTNKRHADASQQTLKDLFHGKRSKK